MELMYDCREQGGVGWGWVIHRINIMRAEGRGDVTILVALRAAADRVGDGRLFEGRSPS